MVYIIIPVFNRIDLTLLCLSSLKNNNFSKKIVVIDDGSTDNTSTIIRKLYPSIKIINGDGNWWWTRSINEGVRYVLSKCNNNDSILTLNNDLVVDPDYLKNLTAHNLLNKKVIIGSPAIDIKDRDTIVDGGVRINWLTAKYKILNQYTSYQGLDKNQIIPVDMLPGRGTLIPVTVFEEIGLYNEKYLPQYAADYEFTIRAKKQGYGLFIVNNAVVYSHVDKTGLTNLFQRLPWKDAIQSLFSKRSPNNLKYRFYFAWFSAPRFLFILFYVFDVFRVIIGIFRNQLIKNY